MTSRTVHESILCPAPAGWLFDLTQDYTRRLEWDPFLHSAELHGEAAGVGVRAWCVSRWPRWGMETEYVSFKRPDVVAVKMTKGPRILSKFAGSWRFEEEEGWTRVTFRYTFSTVTRLLLPIAQLAFARDTHRRLVALRDFCLTAGPARRAA